MRKQLRHNNDETPEATGKQIDILGKKLLGRRVKMTGCRFWNVSMASVSQVEDTVANHQQDIIEAEPEGWINFWIIEAGGNLFLEAYASLEKMGEFITAIRPNTNISLEGVVFWIYSPVQNTYGLMADKVVVIGPFEELQWPSDNSIARP